MKIMKLLASCAIIGALASTTVMAAESDFLGEYNATDNSIAIDLTATDVTNYCKSVTGDLTILVTNVDAAGTITNTNIFQIDQGTVATLDNDGDDNTTTAVLKLSEAVATDYAVENRETDSVYYVRLGGAEGSYIYDTFTFAVPEVVYAGYVSDNAEDTEDVAIGAYYEFTAPEAGATGIKWTVEPKEGDSKWHVSPVNVAGGATYKLGLIIQGLAESAVKSITAVLQ